VKIFRSGVAQTVLVTLAELHPEAEPDAAKPDSSTVQPARADALDGVAVQDLSAHIRHQLGAVGVTGAFVTQVDRASNSFEAGLRWGDIIQEINRQPVANAADAVRLGKLARSPDIVIKVWRPVRGGGGTVRYLSVDNTKRTP
jgi:serine protease Do